MWAFAALATNYSLWVNGRGGGVAGDYADFTYRTAP